MNSGISVSSVVKRLNLYLRGWNGYYKLEETTSHRKQVDSWLRRRLRCYILQQWKTRKNRCAQLVRLGVPREYAKKSAGSRRRAWRNSREPAISRGLNINYFDDLGLIKLYPVRG